MGKKSFMKKWVSLLLTGAAVVSAFAAPVSAMGGNFARGNVITVQPKAIEPRFSKISMVTIALTPDKGFCSIMGTASVQTDKATSVSCKVVLKYLENGGWKTVATYYSEGTDICWVLEDYDGPAGFYQAIVTGTGYKAGTTSESVTVYSDIQEVW